jgi:hypothetical protein
VFVYLNADDGRYRLRLDLEQSDPSITLHLRRLKHGRPHAMTVYGAITEISDDETAVIAVDRVAPR